MLHIQERPLSPSKRTSSPLETASRTIAWPRAIGSEALANLEEALNHLLQINGGLAKLSERCVPLIEDTIEALLEDRALQDVTEVDRTSASDIFVGRADPTPCRSDLPTAKRASRARSMAR